MNFNEDTLKGWSKGPGDAEREKCENTERAIRNAIAEDAELSKLGIETVTQGSYRARTNVKQDSDVDICIRCRRTFLFDLPDGTTRETFGITPATLHFADYKNKVEGALRRYFKEGKVSRGNKAFDIHANSYRVDADVVPTFEYRYYRSGLPYIEGVAFLEDRGPRIVNFPDQTDGNGIARNDATSRRYKRCIRILKNLRNNMQEQKVPAANHIASFLIECLVWNANTDAFKNDEFTAMIRHILIDLWNRTKADKDCSEWCEVNGVKLLFHSSQPWNQVQAHQFIEACWRHMGYS